MALTTPFPGRRPSSAARGAALNLPASPSAAALALLQSELARRLVLGAILALSAVFELYRLNLLGTPNEFYAAAVLSMTRNWHAFWFNAFDANGFVTIDKPPLGFWLQAISAKALGFSGFSILLPEALATVGSVALLYLLVKRAFGTVAGLLAALFLALMPINVVTGRNNTIDALLVFTLLLATYTTFRAVERGSLKWLLATAVLVGLGFEIKMLEAYLVLPALGLGYLLAATRRRWTRLGHLALATSVLLVVSLAWPVAVDLTPASQRPWIDSTQDNSAVDLALGYNGVERLLGQRTSLTQFVDRLTGQATDGRGNGGARNGRFPGGQPAQQASSGLPFGLGGSGPGPFGLGSPVGNAGPGGFGGGPGGLFDNGNPGLFRLFGQQLGGQASWLLPLALLGTVLGAWTAWRRRRTLAASKPAAAGIVWGVWLLTTAAFFSVAGFFHSYYLVTLGPPVAALAAIGVIGSWQLFRLKRWLSWLLPLALVVTALVEWQLMTAYPTYAQRLGPVVLAATAVAALALIGARFFSGALSPSARLLTAAIATTLAVGALLVAPAIWGGQQTFVANANNLPSAGPVSQRGGFGQRGGFPGGPGGFPGQGGSSASLISFLEANQGSASYLAAVPNSNSAAPLILASNGQPVMAIGGFSGSDPILTAQQFAQMVKAGVVRYYVGGGRGGFGGGFGGGASGSISGWVQANCSAVPTSQTGGTQVYDCAPAA